jgi:hypothetical protein
MLVGCTGNDAGSDHSLSVRIRLSQTSVSAGQPIHGVAVVTNSNAHTVLIVTCHHQWIQVGLTGATVPFEAPFHLCRDNPGTTVQPGTSRMPITIQTTYPACTPTPRSATARMPACLRPGPHRYADMPPPLPPGHYFTKTVALSPEGAEVNTSPPIKVIITS